MPRWPQAVVEVSPGEPEMTEGDKPKCSRELGRHREGIAAGN